MTTSSDPVVISVLIRTFNSAKTLDQVLSRLVLKKDEEYIVVDSGSTDSTLAVAESHGARIIRAAGPFNYSKSLNLGFEAARNPWVLVISSHSISVVSDLLGVFRNAAQTFPANVAAGYGPNSLNGRGPFNDDKVRFYSAEDYMNIYPFCGNANTLYRRKAWEALPFDEGIRTGEDKAWVVEAAKRGYDFTFVSGALTLNLTQYPLRYMFMKGYSDRRALPYKRMSVLELALSLGSLAKKFLRGGMPFGNWIRYSAHIGGQFFASFRDQNNTPGY